MGVDGRTVNLNKGFVRAVDQADPQGGNCVVMLVDACLADVTEVSGRPWPLQGSELLTKLAAESSCNVLVQNSFGRQAPTRILQLLDSVRHGLFGILIPEIFQSTRTQAYYL